MNMFHHPLLLEAVKPNLRIALKNIRHKLHCFLLRLTARPAAQLVLIGLPGTGKITLSNQIILIEAVEPGSQSSRAVQSTLNFILKLIRFAVQNLKLPAESNQNQKSFSGNESSIGLKEIDSCMDEHSNEPPLHAITASTDLWNFVTAKKGFAEI